MNTIVADIGEPRFLLFACRNTEILLSVYANEHDCTIVMPPMRKMVNSLIIIKKEDATPNHVIIKSSNDELIKGHREWRLWQQGDSVCLCPNDENWRPPREYVLMDDDS